VKLTKRPKRLPAVIHTWSLLGKLNCCARMMMIIDIIMCKVCEAVSPLPGSAKSCVSDWIWNQAFELQPGSFCFCSMNSGLRFISAWTMRIVSSFTLYLKFYSYTIPLVV
jgi:hypothetical protein